MNFRKSHENICHSGTPSLDNQHKSYYQTLTHKEKDPLKILCKVAISVWSRSSLKQGSKHVHGEEQKINGNWELKIDLTRWTEQSQTFVLNDWHLSRGYLSNWYTCQIMRFHKNSRRIISHKHMRELKTGLQKAEETA